MAGEMFGAPAGISARQQDDQLQTFRDLQAQEMAGNIRMQPSQLQINQVKAQEAQLDLNMRQQFAAQALADQGASGNSPADMAGQLDKFASTAFNAGMVDKGSQFAAKAAEIRSHTQTALSAAAMEQERKLTTAIKFADTTNRIFGNATDDATWNAANTSYEQIFGKPSPFAGMSYDPDLVKKIGYQSMEVKDRLTQQRDDAKEQSLELLRKNEQVERDAKVALDKARTNLVNVRANAIQKAGGGTKTTVGATRRIALEGLTNDWEDMSKSEAGAFADQISERAGQLLRENPALQGTEAVTRAYGEMKDADSFYGYTPRMSLRPTKTPQPLPASQDKLMKGQVYQTKRGAATWNGSAFEVK